ncbi:MAG: MFS transporter, partial [Rhodococcus fascians]
YVLALALIKPSQQTRPVGRLRIADSLGTIRRSPLIMTMLLVGFVVSGATDVFATLTPALSVEFVGDASGTGWIISGFGAGAFVSAFLIVPWIRRYPHRLTWTVASFALGLVCLASAPNLAIAIVGAAVAGGGFLASSNRALSLVQENVPPAELGRAMAVWLIAFLGGRPLFAVIDGLVSDLAGPRLATALVAAFLTATSMFAFVAGSRLRSKSTQHADIASPSGPNPPAAELRRG